MPEQNPDKLKGNYEFLDRVKKLAQEDNGYKASLRRSAGRLLNTADGKAVTNFYKAYSNEPYYEDQSFFTACIQCLWNADELSRAVPLAAAAKYLDESGKATLEKRLIGLLDLSWENDGYLATKLFRLIKFCKSKGVVIDTKALLADLKRWDNESRIVQRKWIREFYNIDFNSKKEDK